MLLAKKIRKVFLGLVALCIMVGCIKTSYIPSIQFNVQAAGVFNTYNLTETELIKIASLCQQEQGTAKGAAAEASLMANRFEMYGSKFSSVYDYARNSGWFAKAGTYMDKMNATDAVIEAVRNVLIYGKRTLPGYIDEHDCFSDLKSCTNNGVSITIKDRSQYKQFVTIINNVYGSKYTFYCFPTSSSDPFGYISETKRSQIGEAYYDYDTGELINGRDPIPELVTPIISTDKSSYNVGDTVYVSWAASPSGSNLSHYWLQIFSPDGSTLLNETMNMSTSYSFKPTQSGEYKIVAWATPSGSKEGEGSLTDTKTIYVNSSEPKFYMSDNRVDIDMDNSTQHYVRFSYSNYDGPITISYEHGTRTFTQLEWGEWENNSIKLYVSGFQSGDEIITVKFKNSNTSEVLKTFTFIASMTGTLRASPEKQIYYLDLDNPQPVDVIFRVMSTPSSGYLHLESWSDENGYYYADDDVYAGGIKAIPSIYREGDAVYVKYTVTPKKIGAYLISLIWEENDGTRWVIGQTEAIVKGDPKFSVNKNNIVLNLDKSETETIHFKYTKDFLWNHQNIQVKRNGEKTTDLKWGQWQDHEIDLTFSGYRPGKETITFELYDTETKEVLATQNVVVEVTGTTKLLVSDSNVKLNMDKNEEFSVVFTAAVIPVTTKTFNINVVRNGTKAANLKWGAWNNNIIELTLSGYRPGKETITFELYDTETKELLATQDIIVEVLGEIKGDCNADGEFSVSDVVIFQKWLLADPSATLNNWKAADLCEDDRLDVFDLCLMKRMLVENS